ncbi:DEAD/DEAH box helicase [Chelativorans composti]|uniref:DEAD/DEAH box helicase n=1 Tax=Chelativorans composti TaxID=768533 RepID=A0ABW5DKB2_9HYPH
MTDFSGVVPALARALANRGYETLTPVQQSMLDPALARSDALVSAQTGSGKTVAFGLAMAPTLLDEAERFGPAAAPLAMVIAPTRELALQVRRELEWLYAETSAVIASCVGGMDIRSERRALERGAHIVVGTPGRICDHIRREALDLSALKVVVLDEADEMLDLGFREDLEFILESAPDDRRTLMFSATVPAAIARLAKQYQRDAVRIATQSETRQHGDIEYRALLVSPSDREHAIFNVLRYYEAPMAIVFCSTRAAVNHLTARFNNRNVSVVALSGELSQNERNHALQSLRDGRARVCIATDVAARGIDLPGLDLVIHADLPTNPETLLHRSGRTGRAGRKGICTLIVPANQRRKAERLLESARVTATWANAPSADEVQRRDDERLLADPVFAEDVREEEEALVRTLVESHGADRLAAAFVRLYCDRHSAPEELTEVPLDARGPRVRTGEAGSAPRRDYGSSAWFSLSVGRRQNAEPRWLIPMLCRVGNLSKAEIGAIRMQANETFVEIAASHADAFLSALGRNRTLERGITVRSLDGAPDLSRRADTRFPGGRSGGRFAGDRSETAHSYGERSTATRKRRDFYEASAGPASAAPKKHRARSEDGKASSKPFRKKEKPASPKGSENLT